MYDGTHFTSVRKNSPAAGTAHRGPVMPEDIHALIVEANRMRSAVIGDAIAALVAGPVLRYRRWKTTRVALRELESLDDRMLADIGVSRDQVRTLALRAAGVEQPAEQKGVLAALVRTRIAEPLARWRMRNRTRRELSALDNTMLHDIGIERGQIDGIARAVSNGNLAAVGAPVPVGLALGWIDVPTPANSNRARPRVAVVTDAAD